MPYRCGLVYIKGKWQFNNVISKPISIGMDNSHINKTYNQPERLTISIPSTTISQPHRQVQVCHASQGHYIYIICGIGSTICLYKQTYFHLASKRCSIQSWWHMVQYWFHPTIRSTMLFIHYSIY